MTNILLVDDDQVLSAFTRDYLESKELKVKLCHHPAKVNQALLAQPIHLCVLDIKMPGMDGYTLAAEIRKIHTEMPIIFLTGQNLDEDRIKGFLAGADDYLAKPFSMEELYLRIQAVLKRYQAPTKLDHKNKRYEIGNMIFNSELREILVGESVVQLTSIESKLLGLLCDNLNKTLSRDTALNAIWGDNDIYKGRSMNVYITKLRSKLKLEPRLSILNAHGEGYCLSFRDDPMQLD